MISSLRLGAGILGLATLAAAPAFAATVVPVTGTFEDYRFIGVSSPGVTAADVNDLSKWGSTPANTWTVEGTITLDGGNVIGLDLRGGPFSQIFATSGGVAQAQGDFFGLAYTLTGDGRVAQTPGNGAEFVAGVLAGGSCTSINSGPTTACNNQLTAFQTEANQRFTNWNGIPDGFSVSSIFACGTDCFFFAPLNPLPAVAWTINGDSIIGQLTRNEPGGSNGAQFNAAFAAKLNLQVVPVPAAVWLFGSALGLLGVARRRAAA